MDCCSCCYCYCCGSVVYIGGSVVHGVHIHASDLLLQSISRHRIGGRRHVMTSYRGEADWTII